MLTYSTDGTALWVSVGKLVTTTLHLPTSDPATSATCLEYPSADQGVLLALNANTYALDLILLCHTGTDGQQTHTLDVYLGYPARTQAPYAHYSIHLGTGPLQYPRAYLQLCSLSDKHTTLLNLGVEVVLTPTGPTKTVAEALGNRLLVSFAADNAAVHQILRIWPKYMEVCPSVNTRWADILAQYHPDKYGKKR